MRNSDTNAKRKRKKNKYLKFNDTSFEKTYEMLLLLEETLCYDKEEKLPCNLDEEWIAEFRKRFLKGRTESKGK